MLTTACGLSEGLVLRLGTGLASLSGWLAVMHTQLVYTTNPNPNPKANPNPNIVPHQFQTTLNC